MPHDQPRPITLAIADCPSDLQVVGFTGREALNETWRFDIDLISRDPHLDISALLQRSACLTPDPSHAGIHGEIGSASQVYAGTCLSHYRISLWPRLQRLAQPRRQQLFHNLSAPQLIEHLLRERGLDARHYRFEPLCGAYPPRPLCVQHQESDLHLLQRVCEEEGIHFRFDGQQLVFADDCASFPERPGGLHFIGSSDKPVLEQISHLAESLALQPAQVHMPAPLAHSLLPPEPHSRPVENRQADNQAYPPAPGMPEPDMTAAWQRQRSARQLQRLRSEHRQISGCSQQPTLACGQIVQVLGHPEPRFNDHWLLTWVRHVGRQPEALEGHDPHDVAAIIRILSGAKPSAGLPADRFDSGYRNSFGVVPWTEPFRPSLRHPKTALQEVQTATLMGNEVDAQGCLPVRLDWQVQLQRPGQWPRALLALNHALPAHALQAGSRVQIGYLDNDADRPVIYALLPPSPDEPASRWWLDGEPLKPPLQHLAVRLGQALRIQSSGPLTVRGLGSVQIDAQAMTATSPGSLQIGPTSKPAPHRLQDLQDLRLPPHGSTPARCLWYIVRMARPGLEHLSRLDPEHFLFEGRTDAEGYLGLTPEQRRQLTVEYARTPDNLCLIHPGRCITLSDFFSQHGGSSPYQTLLDP